MTSFLIAYAVAGVAVLLFAANWVAVRGRRPPFSQDPFSTGATLVLGPILVAGFLMILSVAAPLYALGLLLGPMVRRVEKRHPYPSTLAHAARQAERAQARRVH